MADWLLILGMTVVTFLPRYLPLAFVDNFVLPPLVMRALPYVPIAALSAIVSQNIFYRDSLFYFSLENEKLIAATFAFFIAWASKKLSLTVIFGLLCYFSLRYF